MENNSRKEYQLLCLPFAGGNETSYLKFEQYLDPRLEMVNIFLPGKGKRITEKPLSDINEIVKEIGQQCIEKIDRPYFIYGHSMGGILSHLLLHYLREKGFHLPLHFFCSSCFAPSHQFNKKRKLLSDSEFISELKRLNGLPKELLNNKELIKIFLPIIRADIDAIDGYQYETLETHEVPISIIVGSKEKGLFDSIKDWSLESSAKTDFYRLKGDHFFIYSETEKLCEIINRGLS